MRLTGREEGGAEWGRVPKGNMPEKAFILMNSSRTVGLEMGYRIWKVKRNQQQGQTLSDTAKAVLTKKYGRQLHRLLLQELGGGQENAHHPFLGALKWLPGTYAQHVDLNFFFFAL